jgi:cation transport regulator ChaC
MCEKDIARTVKCKTVGRAKLNNFTLGFTRYSYHRKGGVADIVPMEGEWLEGMLFEVPDFDELDKREGHPTIYVRTPIKVQLDNGKHVTAQTYQVVNKSKEEYEPSSMYARLILEGAEPLTFEYMMKLVENIGRKRKKRPPFRRITPVPKPRYEPKPQTFFRYEADPDWDAEAFDDWEAWRNEEIDFGDYDPDEELKKRMMN